MSARVFGQRYDAEPTHAAAAPGRVNLIGEHTDYNLGYALPIAIDRQTRVLARQRSDTVLRVCSTSRDDSAQADLNALPGPGDRIEPSWARYPLGALALWQSQGENPSVDRLERGMDLLIDTQVPSGGGLSSSAALTVAILTLCESVTGRALSPLNKAKLAQRVEHDYAKVPCGLMDPLISAAGIAGHALLLDCRDETTTPIAMPDELAVIVANTNASHDLADGAYAQRRATCERAASKLGLSSLREATTAVLDVAGSQLDAVECRRARHVVTENERVLRFVEGLRHRDWPTLGACLYDSHASLRDDYDVTTAELDALVDCAAALGPDAGVIGARMTGGGFGGCTVTLAFADRAVDIAKHLAESYLRTVGREASVFITRPGEGAAASDPAG